MSRPPVHPARKPASKKKKIVLLFVATGLALLLGELTMRIILAIRVGPHLLAYGMNSSRSKRAEPFKDVIALRRAHESEITVGSHDLELANYSKYVPNETRRDIDENGTLFKVTINSRGFRGRDFTDQKSPGVVRVVTLGASSTFGYHDRDDETYPHYLQEVLNQQCKSSSFEVINLGIPHLTSDKIHALLMAEGLPLDPDVVTFYEGFNDSDIRITGADKPKNARRPRAPSFGTRLMNSLRGRFLLAGFVHSLYYRDETQYINSQQYEESIEGIGERFLGNLSNTLQVCRSRGILFVVASQQVRSYPVLKDPKQLTYQEEVALVGNNLPSGKVNISQAHLLAHATLMEHLKSWASQNDVPFVDVIEELNHDRDVVLTCVHLSPRGNQLVAGALAREILKHSCASDGARDQLSHLAP